MALDCTTRVTKPSIALLAPCSKFSALAQLQYLVFRHGVQNLQNVSEARLQVSLLLRCRSNPKFSGETTGTHHADSSSGVNGRSLKHKFLGTAAVKVILRLGTHKTPLDSCQRPVRGIIQSVVLRRDTVCAISSRTRRSPKGSLSQDTLVLGIPCCHPCVPVQGFNQALRAAPSDALTAGAFNTSCTRDMTGLLPKPDIATSKVHRSIGNFTSPPPSLIQKHVLARLRCVSFKHWTTACEASEKEVHQQPNMSVNARLQRHPLRTVDCSVPDELRSQSSTSAETRRWINRKRSSFACSALRWRSKMARTS